MNKFIKREQRQVGSTKLVIDTLGLGGAPLGGNFVDLDYQQAAELIQAAKDAGIGYLHRAMVRIWPVGTRDG